MKKLFTISSAVVLLAASATAQREIGQPLQSMAHPFSVSMDKAPFDTLLPPVRTGCTDDLFLYGGNLGNGNTGFVLGTNSFDDVEKGQIFTNTATGYVSVAFGFVYVAGAGNYAAKVYNTAAGVPSQLLGASAPTPAAAVQNNIMVWAFNPTVFVEAGDFAITTVVGGPSITAGDTLAFFSTELDCGGAQSVEKWEDNTWHTVVSAWDADFDLGMGVIVDRAAGIEDANMPAAGIAPNPSVDYTLLGYQTKENGNVVIRITDLSGKVVMVINEGNREAGIYTRNINVTELSAGTYVYEVSCNNKSVKGRMIVSK
ncbi:MAG: T9SS type A sorting domain-containing protein [Flavobacteriales bacterium]|nr:T9SS type A sorting domain-containing protein [Flavobacteriales bacterium]